MGRLGTPEEIAQLVLYLASDEVCIHVKCNLVCLYTKTQAVLNIYLDRRNFMKGIQFFIY